MEFSAEMKYVLDTIWLLISGSLVMWMAAGFAMLEAGMVRTKSVTAILTKNISLYALACIAYFAVGYNFMYGAGNDFLGSGLFLEGTSADGGFLFSSRLCSHGGLDRFRNRCGAHQVLAVHDLHAGADGGHLPDSGALDLGRHGAGRLD